MLDYQEIINKSQESYNRFFKDLKYIPKEEEISDITYDTEHLHDLILEKSEQAAAHLKYLNTIKEALEDAAKEQEMKYFPQDHKEVTTHINKIYEEYVEAQSRLKQLQFKLDQLKR